MAGFPATMEWKGEGGNAANMSSGCLIIYSETNGKNLTCLCRTDGEPIKTGKLLYVCYGDSKLRALFNGHNRACEKIESKIEHIKLLSAAECMNTPVGWIYKYDNGKWYVAESQQGLYKLLEEEFVGEKDIDAIQQFLKTNHLSVKEQIDELKKIKNSPIGECEEMEEISINLDESAWRTIDALCEDLECTSEELIRYILLSYVARDYIGEEMPEVTDFKEYLNDADKKEAKPANEAGQSNAE